MARFEKLQDLFDALWRTREARSLASLCDELGASPATIKRLIAFLRDQRGLDIQYDRNLNGYRLERGPEDVNAAVLLGLSGQEISAILEAEALLEQIPPGFMRDETKAVRARLGKARRHALGRGELKNRVRLRMSQLRSTAADAFATVLAALRSRRRLEFRYHSRSRDEEKTRSASPLRLTFYRSNWYLAAWCHEREELRVFSVDRISRPRCLGDPVYDPPADLVAAELDSSYGIFTGKADKVAVLRFNKLGIVIGLVYEWLNRGFPGQWLVRWLIYAMASVAALPSSVLATQAQFEYVPYIWVVGSLIIGIATVHLNLQHRSNLDETPRFA